MWLVLPMGVKNGPAMFQRMIQTCIAHLPFAKVYVDDNMVGSRGKSPEEQLEIHDGHVRQTLEAFRKFKLTLKGVKCYLYMLMIKFCGHVLCNGTRRAAPSKLQAIAKWTPKMIKTVTHMKSFLGLTQFYSMYMPHYAAIVHSLTDQLSGRMTKTTAKKLKAPVDDFRKMKIKMNKITWTTEMEDAFNKVKEELLQNVVLHIANPTKPYTLRVDASDYAIGGVLSQLDEEGRERPVAFFSRKLVGAPGKGQRLWSVREKETYAIVSALMKFRSWVASTKVSVVVETDHQSIQHWWKEDLGAMSGPVGRRGRWHEFLSGFQLEVIYVRGAGHVVADALSRWAYGAVDDPGDLTFDGSMEDMLQVQKWEEEERKLDFAAASDLLASPIKMLTIDMPEVCCSRISATPICAVMDINMSSTWNYEVDGMYGKTVDSIKAGNIEQGYWMFQGRLRHDHLTCVPNALLLPLMKALHGMQHAGPEKLLCLFQRQYECSLGILDLKELMLKICKHCQLCQGLKAKKGYQNKTLEFYPIPPQVFHSLAMDFVDLPHVKYDGGEYDYALVVVCRLSGYIMAIPCNKKGLTAEELAAMFYHRCVWFTGLPKEIFSDQDKLICSSFFKTLCALSGVEQYHSIAYRPQGNGRAEAAVRQVLEALRKLAWQKHFDKKEKVCWVELLPMALFILNDMPGIISPYSPHQLVFGRQPIGPFEVPPLSLPAVNIAAEDWFEKMQQMWNSVKEKLTAHHHKLTEKFQTAHKVTHFDLGDSVWVRRKEKEVDHKLNPLYLGPCEVVEIVRPNRYRVSTPDGIIELHPEDLKSYYPPVGKNGVPFHHYCPSQPEPENNTYVLEKILAHRICKKSGRLQWLCRWKGYGPEHDTWNYAEDFVHGVQSDWADYNKMHKIKVDIKDLKMQ